MVNLTRFLADMMTATNDPKVSNLQQDFLKTPDDVMKVYNLTQAQIDAVRSRDVDKICAELKKELLKQDIAHNW